MQDKDESRGVNARRLGGGTALLARARQLNSRTHSEADLYSMYIRIGSSLSNEFKKKLIMKGTWLY